MTVISCRGTTAQAGAFPGPGELAQARSPNPAVCPTTPPTSPIPTVLSRKAVSGRLTGTLWRSPLRLVQPQTDRQPPEHDHPAQPRGDRSDGPPPRTRHHHKRGNTALQRQKPRIHQDANMAWKLTRNATGSTTRSPPTPGLRPTSVTRVGRWTRSARRLSRFRRPVGVERNGGIAPHPAHPRRAAALSSASSAIIASVNATELFAGLAALPGSRDAGACEWGLREQARQQHRVCACDGGGRAQDASRLEAAPGRWRRTAAADRRRSRR